jgi:ABC-2 type transport system ATP-binding protein
MDSAIEIAGLGRTFRVRRRSDADTVALDQVSLTVGRGEIHGLLGPNGAGKTTLVKVLSTVLLPTSGTARVLGQDVVRDVRAVREVTGVVFGGERGLYTRVTARQNLTFWGTLYRLDPGTVRSRATRLLDRMGLADRADEPVENFSRGMKQRLHLARGLMHDPRVLFLDEPTSGMDPVAAHDFRQLVLELQAEGRTILLTTHDMSEAEALCNRVTLIDQGRVLLSESTGDVARSLGARECVDFCAADSVAAALDLLPGVESVTRRDGELNGWRAYPRGRGDVAAVLIWLARNDVLSGRRSEPSLEEVYLRLVGARGMSL